MITAIVKPMMIAAMIVQMFVMVMLYWTIAESVIMIPIMIVHLTVLAYLAVQHIWMIVEFVQMGIPDIFPILTWTNAGSVSEIMKLNRAAVALMERLPNIGMILIMTV